MNVRSGGGAIPSRPSFREAVYEKGEEPTMEYEKAARMPCLHGLHLRSSVNLVKLAQGFSSEVRLRRGRCEADA